jgi:ribose transport system substrate-binding protein
MKKGCYRSLIFILLVLFSFVSCKRKQAVVTDTKNDDPFTHYRVSCIIPHKDDGSYWSFVVQGLQRGGTDFGLDVKVNYPSLNYDNEQMIDLIRMSIAAKADAIVLPGSEYKGYQDILQNAKDKGIIVVLIDTPMRDFTGSLYVGSDNFSAGKLIGKKAAELSGKKAVIGVISGDPEYYNLEMRLEGLKSVVNQYPDMKIEEIQYDHFDYFVIQDIYKKYEQNRKINTVVCLEGTGAMAIYPIIKQKPRLKIIAFDDSKEGLLALKKHYYCGLIVQQKFNMGYYAIEELKTFRKKGSFSSKNLITPVEYKDAASEK